MTKGFPSMFRFIEAFLFIASVLTFFVAAKVRDTREYIFVGIGVVFAFIGRSILLGTDNWTGPVPGILLLSFGIWFICSKLHKIHLWL
jgi:CHASE2 domain-containing sensor protein